MNLKYFGVWTHIIIFEFIGEFYVQHVLLQTFTNALIHIEYFRLFSFYLYFIIFIQKQKSYSELFFFWLNLFLHSVNFISLSCFCCNKSYFFCFIFFFRSYFLFSFFNFSLFRQVFRSNRNSSCHHMCYAQCHPFRPIQIQNNMKCTECFILVNKFALILLICCCCYIFQIDIKSKTNIFSHKPLFQNAIKILSNFLQSCCNA